MCDLLFGGFGFRGKDFWASDLGRKFLVPDSPTGAGNTEYTKSLESEPFTLEMSCANFIEYDLNIGGYRGYIGIMEKKMETTITLGVIGVIY